jgi:hypothetical protein
MSNAQISAYVLAAIMLGMFVFVLVGKERAYRAMETFPRSEVAGWILTIIALLWFGWLLHKLNFGRFAHLKRGVYIGIPIMIYLLITHLHELLSVRALAGIMLLAGVPMLDAIRWEPSPFRLVLTVAIYIMIIKAMFLVVAPYRWRQALIWSRSNPIRKTIFTAFAGLSGAVFLAIGLFVF